MLNYCLRTCSLVYEIETDDFFEDFYRNKNLFDFSDYHKDWQFYGYDKKKELVR